MDRLAAGIAKTGFVVAVLCAFVALAAGLGYRLEMWHYRTGLMAIGYVFWVAAVTAIVTLAAFLFVAIRKAGNRALVLGAIGVIVAGVTAYVPWHLRQTADSVPAIHDISTDLANPPAFVRAATLRGKDDHPVAYDGPKVGELQKGAYPDVVTLVSAAPAPKAFEAASTALTEMGLELSDIDPANGRIEAVATSLLFGFKDDVVVRVVTVPEGSRIDIRSKSRVGRNDFGANAKRIRAFMAKMRAKLA